MRIGWAAAVLAALPWGSASAADIVLMTSEAPPYQVVQDGVIGGPSVVAMRCILDLIERQYRIEIVPWRRAREVLKSTAEPAGMFLSIPSPDMQGAARLSTPLALEKWFWFQRSDDARDPRRPESKGDVLAAAVAGSNEADWLKAQGFPKIQSAATVEQLITMLLADRVDALLTDQSVFEAARRKAALSVAKIQKRFQKYVPLAAYFNLALVSGDQGFLTRFNAGAARCVPQVGALDDYERSTLQAITDKRLKALAEDARLIAAAKAQNAITANDSQIVIDTKEKAWAAEVKAGGGAMMDAVLKSDVAALLKDVAARSAGYLSEIILMDARGLNIAATNVTSDYWQGDEAKWQQTYMQGPGATLIEDIRYDQSSGQFLSQVSLTVTDGPGGGAVGALTIGINIELALSQ